MKYNYLNNYQKYILPNIPKHNKKETNKIIVTRDNVWKVYIGLAIFFIFLTNIPKLIKM